MPIIGKGVEEIRIREESGIYRVIYTARLPEAVIVQHAFEKTQRTSKRDIELSKGRLSELMKDRR
jgi:phage-related protein